MINIGENYVDMLIDTYQLAFRPREQTNLKGTSTHVPLLTSEQLVISSQEDMLVFGLLETMGSGVT